MEEESIIADTAANAVKGVIVQGTAFAAIVNQFITRQHLRRQQRKYRRRGGSRQGRTQSLQRKRVTVEQVYSGMGDFIFRRAYRMKYQSFQKLTDKLHAHINTSATARRKCDVNDPKSRLKPPCPNGPITTSVRVACALRYFAGGSPYDLMAVYAISLTEVMNSVWYVVQAINDNPDFIISYPTSHDKQREIAEGFRKVSTANFDCCAGAVNGVLIWTHKPSEADAAKSGCASAKFLCGRKHKFGLNCQAVCDVRGKFLDVSIVYPGSTSDCLAFEGMSLFAKLQNHLLASGLCLFGDNAYLNSPFMATPFSGVSGGTKDAYNFYHSQVRIRVECAFGMLVHRWGLLRRAMPLNVSLKKTIALVIALFKLHNFCIDELDTVVPAASAHDELQNAIEGGIVTDGESPPEELLEGGNHFDDIGGPRRRQAREREYTSSSLPRTTLHERVAEAGLTRPVPIRN